MKHDEKNEGLNSKINNSYECRLWVRMVHGLYGFLLFFDLGTKIMVLPYVNSG